MALFTVTAQSYLNANMAIQCCQHVPTAPLRGKVSFCRIICYLCQVKSQLPQQLNLDLLQQYFRCKSALIHEVRSVPGRGWEFSMCRCWTWVWCAYPVPSLPPSDLILPSPCSAHLLQRDLSTLVGLCCFAGMCRKASCQHAFAKTSASGLSVTNAPVLSRTILCDAKMFCCMPQANLGPDWPGEVSEENLAPSALPSFLWVCLDLHQLFC